MMQILGRRVLVALPPPPDEVQTASGLVLMRDPDRGYTPTRGIVAQLGRESTSCQIEDVREAFRTVLEDAVLDTLSEIDAAIDGAVATLARAPYDVKIGDCVIFSVSAGQQVEFDGTEYVILDEREIIGVLEPQKDAAA